MNRSITLTVATLMLVCSELQSQPAEKSSSAPDQPFEITEVWKEKGVIWGLDFISEDQILLTLRDGELKRVNLKAGRSVTLSGIPAVETGGQGGLLDVMVDREFSRNQRIYWTYSKDTGWESATALATARLVGDSLQDVKDLMVAENSSGSSLHFGWAAAAF